MNNKVNPFNITKAFHFSDSEIEKYWTDYGDNGFKDMIKPSDPMPIYILGGKGSGKTHLMRYFSYELQKIRNDKNILNFICKEKYIGIYTLCSGLNSSRFSGKGYEDNFWMKYFEYYFEIWISSLVIEKFIDLMKHIPNFNQKQKSICQEIEKLFDCKLNLNDYKLNDILKFLNKLLKEININVNNNKLDNVSIKVSRGNLIFGIPNIIVNSLEKLKNIQFLYLLDELENFSIYQQKFINTLVRERKSSVSFRIGSRLYGFKTRLTYSDNEDIKIGSEYDELNLDEKLRANEKNYINFAYKLCAKRLSLAGYLNEDILENKLKVKLNIYFEEFNEDTFYKRLITKNEKIIPTYFSKLATLLKAEINNYNVPYTKDTNNDQIITDILRNLTVANQPLLEKINVFLFYKDWSKGQQNLLSISRNIKDECLRFLYKKDKKTNRYSEVLLHYKGDMFAQLLNESRENQKYIGLETYIKMSWGIPRNLLIILKEIFQWAAIFNNEVVFGNKKISIKSQEQGVINSSNWFLDDARIGGEIGKNMMDSLEKLALFFREIRFSDKPSECSVSTFSIDLGDLTYNSNTILDLLLKYSLLINVKSRKNKNSKKLDHSYQINRMLSPIWDLPISRRGIFPLGKDFANSIFDKDLSHNFDKYKNAIIKTMNAPFNKPVDKDIYSIQIEFPS